MSRQGRKSMKKRLEKYSAHPVTEEKMVKTFIQMIIKASGFNAAGF